MKKSILERKVDALAEIVLGCPEIPNALKGKLQDLMSQTGKSGTITAPEIAVNVGIPSHIRGFRYTVCAIDIVARDPDMIDKITSKLYPDVAIQFSTTSACVERAIRHAIELCWTRCDYDTLQGYFGPSIDPEKGKPTNAEFISRLAAYVRGDLTL